MKDNRSCTYGKFKSEPENNVTLSTVIRTKQNLYHKSVYPSLLPLMVQRAILRLKRRLTSEAGKGRGLKEGCSLLLLLLLLLLLQDEV